MYIAMSVSYTFSILSYLMYLCPCRVRICIRIWAS